MRSKCQGEDVEYRDGRYFVKGTDRAISFAEIMQQCSSQAPHPLDTVAEMPIMRAFPSGAHVAEVEIDRNTGWITLLDYTAVDDIGRVINHVLADGQLHGGIMQGAGQVFGEHCLYDEGSGQLVAGSFMDYIMPRADLIRSIRTLDRPVASPGNPCWAPKAPARREQPVPARRASMRFSNALRSAGVEHLDMPATPGRIWAAIQQACSRLQLRAALRACDRASTARHRAARWRMQRAPTAAHTRIRGSAS